MIEFKTTPLFDATWEPKFKSGDLVSVSGINGIKKTDLWVVYGRLVDINGKEWYYLRPGTTNRNKIGKIRVATKQLKRESKYT